MINNFHEDKRLFVQTITMQVSLKEKYNVKTVLLSNLFIWIVDSFQMTGKRELTCFVRSLTGAHPDIELADGGVVALGRSPRTGIKDMRCSRIQLQLTPDYSNYRVRQGLQSVGEIKWWNKVNFVVLLRYNLYLFKGILSRD
jgi:hypothetical protein